MKVVNILDESCESFRWKLWKEVIKAVGDSSRGISGSESTMLSHFWPGLPSCCPVCTPVHISHLYLCLRYISFFLINICAYCPCAYFSSIFVPKVITNEYFWYVTLSTLINLQKWAFFVRPITQCIIILHSFVAECWYQNYFHNFSLKEKIENIKRSDLWMF